MEVIARLQDRALCAEMSGCEIPVRWLSRWLSRWPGAGINPVEAGRGRRLAPSAAFFNTGHPGPACFGVVVCLWS
jgi:hypothetical protein